MSDKDQKSTGMPDIDPEILARAEKAVAALGGDFVAETKRNLSEHRAVVAQNDFQSDLDAVGLLFEFAHDMRGQGSTFGFPFLSEIGASLCHFIESRDHHLAVEDTAILNAHLDAASTILTKEITGDDDPAIRSLIGNLGALVEKRLAGQN